MSSFRATALRLVLAFGLSFAMWAFVSFSQNPEESVTFPDVLLETTNLADGLVLVDSNGLPNPALPTVSVTLRTDRAQLASLRPVDIRVVTDLAGLGAGEHIVPVNVQPTRSNVSFEIIDGGVEPSAVPIRIEQRSNRLVPIEVAVQGNLPFSFERGEPRVTASGAPIETVRVIGPQTRADRVVRARATANIEQLRATYLAPLSLVPIDAAGQPIEGVRLDPDTVTVQIPINPVVGLKLVPVEPEIVGLPAAGFAVEGVTVDPPLIALAGGSGTLDAVVALSTAPIDLNGVSATFTRTVQIIFPEGTSPSEGEATTASVTVQLAPLALPFQAQLPVQVALSGVGQGLLASVNPSVLTISLAGSSAALAGLSEAPLRASVDVAGLGPGSYVLTPTLVLPEGVSVAGEPPTVQVVLRLPAPTATPEAEDETPTETPVLTETPAPEASATPAPEATETPGPSPSPGPSPTPGS